MSKHIIIFSLVSAALHAGLLMVVPSSEHIIEAGSPFRVSILAMREQAPAPKPEKQAPQQPVKHKQVSPEPASTPTPAPNRQTTEKPTIKQATTQAKEVTQQDRTVSGPVQHEVKTEMQAHTAETAIAISPRTTSLLRAELQQAFRVQFYYPRLAVRRGWQGEVRLGLRVASNGTLKNIHILKSSGHGVLDRAAIDSLGKIQQLPAATALLKGRDLALELPVQYRLL